MEGYEEFRALTTEQKIEKLYVILYDIQKKQERVMKTLLNLDKMVINNADLLRQLKKQLRPTETTVKEEEKTYTPFGGVEKSPPELDVPEKIIKEEVKGADVGPPTASEIIDIIGGEAELLNYKVGGVELHPKEFLGDRWSNINMGLEALNYKWVRDGRESHWLFQGAKKDSPKTTKGKSSRKTATSKIESIPTREEMLNIIDDWEESQYGKYSYSDKHSDLTEYIQDSYQERLDYGDFYFKLGGDNGEFINMTFRKFGPLEAPSDKQVAFAKKLGIENPESFTKGVLSMKMSDIQLAERRGK